MLSTVKSLLRRHPMIAAVPLIAVGLGVAAANWSESRADAAKAPEAEVKLVRTMKVEARAIAEGYSAIGEIRPRRESDMGFRVSGKLIERKVDVGASVKKGDLLARLEDQDYRNRLLSAKADQAAAQAVLVEAEADVARDRQTRRREPDHRDLLRRDDLTVRRALDGQPDDQRRRLRRRPAGPTLATGPGRHRAGLRPDEETEDHEAHGDDQRREDRRRRS